ncbi:MAG: response regulator transcription factor [Acidobacteriota bacterium]|nr:response regulator transcription factor [Acidobacteriota bacterium]
MRILIVEDKRSLAENLGRALELEGHAVAYAADGATGLRLGRSAQFDVILLDVMLPLMDGFAVIRRLREEEVRTQAIIVSGRDSMRDVVYGLDAGADDYLTKPFLLEVLLAKIRAAARRVPAPEKQSLQFVDLVFRPERYEVQRGERVETLTRTECALLEVLMRRPRQVVPHAALIEAGWGGDCEVGYDSLYVFIRALRGKITHKGEAELLHTVRGVGYTLRHSSS